MVRPRLQSVSTSQSGFRSAYERAPSQTLHEQLDDMLAPERSRGYLVRVLHHELGASATLIDRVKPFFKDPADVSRMHLHATKKVVVPGQLFHKDPEFNKELTDIILKYQHTSPIELRSDIMMKELKEGRMIRLGFRALNQLRFEGSLRGLDSLSGQIPDNTRKPTTPRPNYIYFDMPSNAMKSEEARREVADAFKQAVIDNPKSHYVIPINIDGFDMHSSSPEGPDGGSELPLAS